MISTAKVAEYRLAAELLARGAVPLWPSSPELPYDIVVASRSRAIRIQVKGTEQTGKQVRVQTKMKDRGSERRYTKADIDILAVYLVAYDAWYFIPVEKVSARGITIRPGDKRCRWERYAKAWAYVGVA